MTFELLQVWIRSEHDVYLMRQRGREVASAIGLEHQDQIRVATALSELGRGMVDPANTPISVRFLAGGVPPALRVEFTGPLVPREDLTAALTTARRLVDIEMRQESGEQRIALVRHLPVSAAAFDDERVAGIRTRLAALEPVQMLERLAAQNQTLAAALDEMQRERDELLLLNAEVEETNRRVLELYRQLSDELEETNRGVVALYGELDRRSVQLREANEAKSRFLANVSHELRAPLTAIIGLARLLADAESAPLSTEQAEQVGLIRGSAADLLVLVNELLDLAKAEAGRLEPHWAEVRLERLFGELEGTVRPLATRPEVCLVVEPAAVPPLVTDEVLLGRVLRNLMANGVKFTERGSVRLEARWHAEDETVRMSVSDTGIGIPPEEQERVFEEFYQVPGARAGGGTGLGLPYARRLVGVLGGTLSLHSEVGVGSVFTVVLPQLPPGAAPSPPAEDARPPVGESARDARPPARDARPPAGDAQAPAGVLPAPIGPVPPLVKTAPPAIGHVLVVDDDPAFRAVVVAALRDEATMISEAGNGREALALIARRPPDLIFLDLYMPEIDGKRLLAMLAADDRWRRIPVVVVSGAELDAVAAHSAALIFAKTAVTPDALRWAARTARVRRPADG